MLQYSKFSVDSVCSLWIWFISISILSLWISYYTAKVTLLFYPHFITSFNNIPLRLNQCWFIFLLGNIYKYQFPLLFWFNIVLLTIIAIIAHPLGNTYLKPILLTIFGVFLKVWFDNRWLVQFDAPSRHFTVLISSCYNSYSIICWV